MSLLDQFATRRLLVLGDVILDRYWWGDSQRLSPEAPVPIVRMQRSTVRAGGAANTAANLVSLGASVELFGVTGADQAAAELRSVIEQAGIRTFLEADATRPTTTKTRVVALHQQVVRVDQEETEPVAEEFASRIAGKIVERIPQCEAVVFSDYAKGFLTPSLTRQVIAAARQAGVLTFIDPKGAGYEAYMGCSVLKPNRAELALLTHQPVRNHGEALAAGRRLRSMMPGTAILVTEGAEGMTWFAPDGAETHADSIVKQVFDVTGAGDTVLAVVALAITAGASPREALDLASRAASIVVGAVGTATVTREQLRGD
jgi:D-beta-D-heptose 7-phosphate kinase/D-beta-D-heptose 1-phosphate adenosyltransferase